MKTIYKFLVILTAVLISVTPASGCQKRQSEEGLTVSAAVSLKEPLEEIAAAFQKEKGIKVNFNFGSSGTLQKQIEEGAPADIFISASSEQMDKLEAKRLIDSSTRIKLLRNGLVLVSPNSWEGIKSLEELGTKKITLAIGETKTVPVGQYAKESLINLKLWDKVGSDIIYGRDASDVLRFVQKGEVQAGIVYESDAAKLDKGYNLIKLPESSHQAIVYPVAITADCKNKQSAMTFIEFLKVKESNDTFRKYKFGIEEQ